MKVFQHLDELKDSDGVGNDAIGLSNVFQSLGFESHFITRIPRKGKSLPGVQFHGVNDFSIPVSYEDIHILHYGGAGYPYKLFQNLSGKKILRFHNITPASFYKETTTKEIFDAMEKFESVSYLELATFSLFCDSIWCDSNYNLFTVRDFKFQNPYILPICKEYTIKNTIPNDSGSLIFVGRYSPQKKWEDLIDFFAEWSILYPNSECYLVGSVIGAFDGYYERLKQKVKERELENKIQFLTGLNDNEVLSYFEKSSVFVSMSEHEGFCLPLLEAFGMGLPVYAYAQTAVPETMRGAGLLFYEKSFSTLTKELKTILSNQTLKLETIQTQKKTLLHYNSYPWKQNITSILGRI
ncbi:glycosyltransferase [Leptospira sp. 96542]|nr:glycosyltransferase [Leptospira sp. 96542]